MKYLKQMIILTLVLIATIPTFSQTAQGVKKVEYNKLLDAKFVQIPNKNYKIMTTEVTQNVYEAVMGENPSKFKGENNPVENVSWLDCVIFCNKLSEKEGYIPCYVYDGTTDTTKWEWNQKEMQFWNWKEWDKFNEKLKCNFEANGYRLPTNDEWEYAAKGGQDYEYSGSNNLDEVGWYWENSGRKTHPVGQKKANGYGLYDMSGNVSEWCWDSSDYLLRYDRGGSWGGLDSYCKVCNRISYYASYRVNGLGFRLCRSIK